MALPGKGLPSFTSPIYVSLKSRSVESFPSLLFLSAPLSGIEKIPSAPNQPDVLSKSFVHSGAASAVNLNGNDLPCKESCAYRKITTVKASDVSDIVFIYKKFDKHSFPAVKFEIVFILKKIFV